VKAYPMGREILNEYNFPEGRIKINKNVHPQLDVSA